ncbi:MAG: glycosyltransferase family 4 protein [Candidatus Melainabacteria bacterium]
MPATDTPPSAFTPTQDVSLPFAGNGMPPGGVALLDPPGASQMNPSAGEPSLPPPAPFTPEVTPAQARKVRVGMVLDAPFPPDARVEREAVALVEAGYEVHLLCTRTASHPERETYYRGMYIHRVAPGDVTWTLPGTQMKTRLPFTGLLKTLARNVWHVEPSWQALIERFIHYYGIDILHVHDLPLVKTGLAVCKPRQIPLVADMHENYPALMAMLKGKSRDGSFDTTRAEHYKRKWDAIESQSLMDADRVITVIDEARERLVHKGIPADKITVLPNTVDVEKFLQAPVDHSIVSRYKSQFVMTYVGFINGEHRGIHTVLEAMALLRHDIPDLFFIAAGGVRDAYMKQLNALIRQHGLEDRVLFTGWMDEADFVSYIEASDICLCPHLVNDHTNATFPNKVYLYNLFKKPVITGSCVPLRRYIELNKCGTWFDSGSAESLAHRIRVLYEDAELRRDLGEQGRRMVLEKYNWHVTIPRLLSVYDSLVDELYPDPLSALYKNKQAALGSPL